MVAGDAWGTLATPAEQPLSGDLTRSSFARLCDGAFLPLLPLEKSECRSPGAPSRISHTAFNASPPPRAPVGPLVLQRWAGWPRGTSASSADVRGGPPPNSIKSGMPGFNPADKQWDVRLCSNQGEGHSFDLMKESPKSLGVLATALRAWVGFELPDDEAGANRTVEFALDLHSRGASMEETCAWVRHFSSRWARTASNSRGA